MQPPLQSYVSEAKQLPKGIRVDEGKIIADFVAKNIEKIWNLGKQVFGVADEVLQINLKTAYADYLASTQKKYSKSKSFFIRHEPVDLYSYYEPTGMSCGAHVLRTPTFRSLVDLSKRVVITGTGGSGKSILIKHLFLDCIKDGWCAPILIELRDLNSDSRSLDEYINYTLDTYGFSTTGDYVKRAKKAGHFCFFFDGFDEVTPSARVKLKTQILGLSKKYPACPIVLSSRPDDAFNGVEDFSVFNMLPLDGNSAQQLVRKLPFDEDIKSKFCIDLAAGLFEKHKSFLSNPLLLSIMLLTYGEHAQIPSKLSIFYNQAYEALFQRHDANKSGFCRNRLTQLDIRDFSRVFSLFSLQTYDKRIFKMPRTQCLEFIEKSCNSLRFDIKPEDYLSDLIGAACILVEDGLEIAFSHRSFQEYFVALHISMAIPEIQKKLISRYWPNMRNDQVIQLLLEINPDLVERELLLPKMEELFKKLEVKRKVGATHAARHFKNTYTSVTIEPDTIGATLRSEKADLSFVLRLAVKHCGTFEMPEKEYFGEYRAALNKKYVTTDGRASFKTDGLTVRSPLLRDILESKSVFSTEHLAAGYQAYKLMTSKHSGAVQDLDNLLGIR